MESDREKIVSLLEELNISVPDYAVFSYDGNGWHSFFLDKHSDGDAVVEVPILALD
jgi:hypothetical protein